MQFLSSLKDNLNAEVALGTVTNVKEACAWLGYTYLFIRMRLNPLAYGIGWDEVTFLILPLLYAFSFIKIGWLRLCVLNSIQCFPLVADQVSLIPAICASLVDRSLQILL